MIEEITDFLTKQEAVLDGFATAGDTDQILLLAMRTSEVLKRTLIKTNIVSKVSFRMRSPENSGLPDMLSLRKSVTSLLLTVKSLI